MKFTRLSKSDGTWNRFLTDWETQCRLLEEDFESYKTAPLSWVEDLTEDPTPADAGAFALEDESGSFHALCQANSTYLPGYEGKVLRVRFIYFAPNYDLGDQTVEQYGATLVNLFYEILNLSKSQLPANHVKFHLQSPTDRQFFAALGQSLGNSGAFSKVDIRGAWLYITK